MVTASTIEVHCAHTAIVDIETVIPNPRNPNGHPDKQIALLAKIIRQQGWRNPIVVSDRSGFVVKGHGRLQAAQLLQVAQVPIDTQHYETEALEWADLMADNRIAELAEIDNAALKDLLQELDAGELDMDLTGFDLEALEMLMTQFHVDGENNANEEWEGMPEFENEPKGISQTIIHFKTQRDIDDFSKITGVKLTQNTKSAWYPKNEN